MSIPHSKRAVPIMSGRVAIIGAGSSGITAIKCFLDAGFSDLVCFERRDVIGGLWYFKDEPATFADEACVYRSTVINTSKEHMAFSDYPMPDHYPIFCHNTEVQAYLVDYCEHFGADKFIHFNMEVLSLKKHCSYSSTGQWELRTKDHKIGQEKTEVFDFVVVANGHHGEPKMPAFPGQDKFQGVIMHSKDFKDIKSVKGTRALVIGIGNSGGDCSVELSKYMKVFMALRRGTWIRNRLEKGGMPYDYFGHNRFTRFINSWLPRWYRNRKLRAFLNERCDHKMFHIQPEHEPDATSFTLNDELPNRIAAGRVVIKPNVRAFTGNGVQFDDGTFEDNIDLVICATGYKIEIPFIDKEILDIRNNKVDMYKRMFLPDLPKQTIAFLAVVQPTGAMFPIAEMQSRLAALVFKGELKLPSAETMKMEMQKYQDSLQKRYVQTERHTIQVDWLPFMDELAVMVGCKPNLLKLLLTDPRLFYHVAFGMTVPYSYRLHGPNTWPGARKAVLTTMDRIKKPFETRTTPNPKNNQGTTSWISYLLVTCAGVAGLGMAAQYVRQNDLDLSKYFPAYLQL